MISATMEVFLGEKIGHGKFRDVYECKIDPTLVVKVETASKSFKNVTEWLLWKEIKDTKYAQYYAPCVDISPCGTILLMKKVSMPTKDKYPKKIFEPWSDLKYSNYGLYEGRLVCIDYAQVTLSQRIKTDKTKGAQWREEN